MPSPSPLLVATSKTLSSDVKGKVVGIVVGVVLTIPLTVIGIFFRPWLRRQLIACGFPKLGDAVAPNQVIDAMKDAMKEQQA